MQKALWDAFGWANHLCYESVLLAASALSAVYGVCALYIGMSSLLAPETVILAHYALPYVQLSWLLIGGGVISIIAVYREYRRILYISLHLLLAIWVLLAVSFVFVDGRLPSALLAGYQAILYSWVLWRIRGLILPKF